MEFGQKNQNIIYISVLEKRTHTQQEKLTLRSTFFFKSDWITILQDIFEITSVTAGI